MGKLNLDQIQPGMALASDVFDRNGRILLKAGMVLSDKHLTILKQWGITDADISGIEREEVNAQITQALDPDALAHAETLHKNLFRHTDMESPFISELYRLAVLRHVNDQTYGGSGDSRPE